MNKLPTDFCTIVDSQDAQIDQIFPNVHRKYTNQEWLAERAILAAKNMDVNELNPKIQHLLPRDSVSGTRCAKQILSTKQVEM
jgi:hypothetical protein